MAQHEDGDLDRHLSARAGELEKARAATDAYRIDLLQQKLGERELDLQALQEALASLEEENTGLRGTVSQLETDKHGSQAQLEVLQRELARVKAPAAPAPGAAPEGEGDQAATRDAAAVSTAAEDAGQLAHRVQEEGAAAGVDTVLLASVARALRDKGVLDQQLKRAREEIEKRAKEMEELTENLFSKSFRAPSAWAEREVKYKAEKRDWGVREKALQATIDRLRNENLDYRSATKAADFERQIQELKAQVRMATEQQVAAQRELHETRLQGRSMPAQNGHRSFNPDDAEGVHSIIEGLEQAGIGVMPLMEMRARRRAQLSGNSTPTRTGSPRPTQDDPAGMHVEDLVSGFDASHTGMGKPPSRRQKVFGKPWGEPGDSPLAPHASAGPEDVNRLTGRTISGVRRNLEGTGEDAAADQNGNAVGMAGPADPSRAGPPPLGSSQGLQQQLQQQPGAAAQPDHLRSGEGQQAGLEPGSAGPPDRFPPSAGFGGPGAAPPGVHMDPAHAPRGQPGPGREAGHEASAAAAAARAQVPSLDLNGLATAQGQHPAAAAQGRPDGADRAASAAAGGGQAAQSAPGPRAEQSPNASSRQSGPGESQDRLVSMMFSTTGLTPRGSQGAARPAEDPAHGDFLESSESGMFLYAERAEQQQQQQQQQSHSPTEPSSPFGAPAQQARTPPSSQRQRPSPDGPSPGLEPFYTAASALPELAKAGATSPADGVSAADMDAAFAEEPDSPPKDTYLRGRGSAASQPEEGRGTAEGRGLEAGQQLRSHADSGHISISSPFQEGPRTPLTPRANSGGSGILSRRASSSPADEFTQNLRKRRSQVEQELVALAAETDPSVLRYKLTEMETRVELYDAQLARLQQQVAAQDDEKAALEFLLHQQHPDGSPGQEAAVALVEARRELADVKGAHAALQLRVEQQGLTPRSPSSSQELATSPSKPPIGPRASRSFAQGRGLRQQDSYSSVHAGFSEGDLEVSHIREENETLMEALVLAKIEAAESQGETLKSRRALLRSVDRQAVMLADLEDLRGALERGDVPSMQDILNRLTTGGIQARLARGNIESLGDY